VAVGGRAWRVRSWRIGAWRGCRPWEGTRGQRRPACSNETQLYGIQSGPKKPRKPGRSESAWCARGRGERLLKALKTWSLRIRTNPTPQTQTRPNRLHTHTHPPKRLAHPRSPIPPLLTLTSRATHAHPTSPRSTGFCAIWDCISSSSSPSCLVLAAALAPPPPPPPKPPLHLPFLCHTPLLLDVIPPLGRAWLPQVVAPLLPP